MKVLNRYFTRKARSLKMQLEIRELYKQIRTLNKKQQKIYDLTGQDEAEVRQMFNDGAFNHYGHMTSLYLNKLINRNSNL